MNNKTIKLLAYEYENGASVNSLSEKYNFSVPTIRKYIYPLVTKHKYGSWAVKYSFDKNFFKTIDTQEKAYWLGFIYADGCVEKHGLSILLSTDDIDHIEKFKNDLKSTHPIASRAQPIKDKGKIVRIQNSSRIRISSIELAADLIRLGVFYNKSKILKFPNEDQVPAKFIHHFMRGYFDGDGSIWKSINKSKVNYCYGFSLISSNEFVMSYTEKLKELIDIPLSPIIPTNTDGISFIRYRDRSILKKIYNFLYTDSTVFLDRKKLFFNSIPFETRLTKFEDDKMKILKTVYSSPDGKTAHQISELLNIHIVKTQVILKNLRAAGAIYIKTSSKPFIYFSDTVNYEQN